MAKTKKRRPARSQAPTLPAPSKIDSPAPTPGQPFRETVESFAIAIILAFLIRTFAAEAFVIPTGSMANTLMGQHQDVHCVQCGERYRVSASDEQDDSILRAMGDHRRPGPVTQAERNAFATVAGTCPTCRDTMLYSSYDIPESVLRSGLDVENTGKPYGGDRILVNKYIYDFQSPERWDVIVFKYPGNANTNYIKRLVGLPNEVVQVYHGDLFIGAPNEPLPIARKPVDKLLAMRELVHDTNHDAAELFHAGWPLRWRSNDDQWKTTTETEGKRVVQKYAVEQPSQKTAWLRYEHTPARIKDWLHMRKERPAGEEAFVEGDRFYPRPQLVADFNPYNSNVRRQAIDRSGMQSLVLVEKSNGIHWVGDLILKADVSITSDNGVLLLDLVKAGRHFVCRIDVATGQATLGIEEFETRAPVAGFAPQAETAVNGPGDYKLRFAHADEQLHLWVDGNLVEFSESTAYDYEQLFGDRENDIPRTGDVDLGDLAPAAIGARGATLAVDRLHLSRDIYYIAAKAQSSFEGRPAVTDYPPTSFPGLLQDPAKWGVFRDRSKVEFPLGENQFFVMGDNSPASQDARLWSREISSNDGRTVDYLDGNLLIGKAVFVYWPHSWYTIPGTPIPLWPNFRDMRLVR